MAYIVADGVRETTRTVGFDALALIGADVGFQRFADVIVDGRALQIGDTCPYAVRATTGSGAWETGIGIYSAVNTLTRTTILSSSNSNNAVDFGVGLKTVFMGPISGVLPPFNPQSRTLDLSIDALRDVTISAITLADKQTLSYNLESKAWVNVPASLTTGTVTSVGLIAPTALGLTVTGVSPITSKGEFTLGGILAVAHGGTGRTTALPLSALGDVQFSTTPVNGQILKYEAATSKWCNVAESPTGTVTSVTISGGDTGIAVTSYTTTTAAKFTLGGKLAVAYGGTGITTPLVLESLANVTLTSLANNQVLKYNSTAAKWVNATDVGNAGTVISVAFGASTTGLNVTGGPITVSGTFELVGMLNVESGGTGLSVAGDKGQVLKVDETTGLLSYQTLANPNLVSLPDVSITALENGHILKYNSVSKLWDNVPDSNAGGTVTSVGIITPTTFGLTATGGPITSKGDFTLGGILAVLHGGTGLPFFGDKGQVLTVNSTKTALEYQTLTKPNLHELPDVSIVDPVAEQVLKYRLGAWVNAADTVGAGTVTGVTLTTTTNLTVTTSPITAGGNIAIALHGGPLNVVSGGTGINTPLRLTSLADVTFPTTLADKQVLKYDLASLKWVNATDVAGTGTVRSVAFDGGTTGLFASVNGAKGAAIIDAGKFVLSGVLAVGSGGTGLTTPGIAAANHVLKVNAAGNALTFQPLVIPNLDDLLDVTIAVPPSGGQILTYVDSTVINGATIAAHWANRAPAISGTVTGVTFTTTTGLTATASTVNAGGNIAISLTGGPLNRLSGGTGLSVLGAPGQVLRVQSDNSLAYQTLSTSLDDLSDVLINAPADGQILKYFTVNPSGIPRWENATAPPSTGGTVTSVVINPSANPGTTGLGMASISTIAGAITIVLGGTLAVTHGGTGTQPNLGLAGQVLAVNTNRNGYTFTTPATGGGGGVTTLNNKTGPIRIVPGNNNITMSTTATPGGEGWDIAISGVAGGASGVTTVNGQVSAVNIVGIGAITVGLDASNNITISGAAGGTQLINPVTAAAYAVIPADAQKLVTLNRATAIDVFVPYDPTNTFPVGTGIDFIQTGAGQVTFTWDFRISLSTASGYKMRTIFSGCTLTKLATDTWVLVGDTVV